MYVLYFYQNQNKFQKIHEIKSKLAKNFFFKSHLIHSNFAIINFEGNISMFFLALDFIVDLFAFLIEFNTGHRHFDWFFKRFLSHRTGKKYKEKIQLNMIWFIYEWHFSNWKYYIFQTSNTTKLENVSI